jgi:general secretion pathway protein G
MPGLFPRSIQREMKINPIKWKLVLPCGWLVIFVAATIILPPIDSRVSSGSAVLILALTVVWLLLTTIALGVYFYRAWQRVSLVPNKTAHVGWLGFETVCALAMVGGFVWLFVSSGHGDSIPKMRELTLRQDLYAMRAILDQYSDDKHNRPQSIEELVATGYLKQVPTDPITGRRDSWVLEWSNDPKTPGIVNIRSGSQSISSQGTAYRDW